MELLINPLRFLDDGRPVFGASSPTTRANPVYNNIALQDIGNNSSYNALIVNYQHRTSHGFSDQRLLYVVALD